MPGFKNIIKNMINYIQSNIINNFMDNEYNIENIDNKNKDEIEREYFDKLMIFSTKSKNEIEKDNLFSKISNKFKKDYELSELYDLFINDYFVYFLNENCFFVNNINNSKKFMNLIAEFFDDYYNEDNQDITYLNRKANQINWIECYKEEIISLLKIYSVLDSKIQNLYSEFKEKIKYNKNIFNNEKLNINDYITIIDKTIFIILKSLIQILISNEKILDDINENEKKITDIINLYKDIFQTSSKILSNININLSFNEKHSLKEITEIFNAFYQNQIYDKEKYLKVLKYVNFYMNRDNSLNINQNFEDLCKLVNSSLNNNKNYFKIMNMIFSCEISKYNDDKDFKTKILNIIIDKNELIIDSSYLINIIMNEILKFDVENIQDNFTILTNYHNQEILKILNNCDKIFLDEILINYFEIQINLYFNSIKDIDDDLLKKYFNQYFSNKKKYNLLFGQTLEIFAKLIKYLSEKDKIHLCLLYAISYIKIYLDKVIYYLINNLEELPSIKDINDIIVEMNNENISRVIKIYIFKLFYKYKKNYNEMVKYIGSINQFTFSSNFEWKIKNENEQEIKEEYDNGKKLNLITHKIIEELDPPEKYSEEDYPLYKYFMLAKYSNIESLKTMINNKKDLLKKYPLLDQLLSDNTNLQKLEILPYINDFCNYMLNKYNYKISRNKALEKKLDQEDLQKPELEKFLRCWKKIKDNAIQYENREKMISIDLGKNNELIFFLNDDKELNFGMHIAAAYESFITWQNEFLNKIIKENESEEDILHFCIHNLKNEIQVQTAKNSNVLNLDDINLENIINQHSKRDIYKSDGNIDYTKYNSFIYDFESIEIELGEKILPGLCLFDKTQKFIVFWSEGNPEILTNFIEKYPQNELNEDEKNIIINYLKDRYKKKKFEITEFFASFQLLLFYLDNYSNKLDEENISTIIKQKPDYLRVSMDFKNFFENEGNIFKINQMMNIFLFIEHLSFEPLCENLDNEIKNKKISDQKEQQILTALTNIQEKVDLSRALRRYISRYLVGKKKEKELLKNKLASELSKSDLWGVNKDQINEINKFLSEVLAQFNLIVEESFSFYNIIGKEDKEFVKDILGKEFDNDEDNIIIGDDDEFHNIPKHKKYKRNKIADDDDEGFDYNDVE